MMFLAKLLRLKPRGKSCSSPKKGELSDISRSSAVTVSANATHGTSVNALTSPADVLIPSINNPVSNKAVSSANSPVSIDKFRGDLPRFEGKPQNKPKLWGGLSAFQKVMNHAVGSVGSLKGVVNDLVECVEVYEKAASGREEYKILRKELEGLFQGLIPTFSRPLPLDLTLSAESLCSSIRKELEQVRNTNNKEVQVRHIETIDEADQVLQSYRRIHAHLQRLTLNVNLTIWATMDDLATENRLQQLSFSGSVCYNSAKALDLRRGPVAEGTRVDILKQMFNWVYDPLGSVYWISGTAGTGKTTIAYSLCAKLESEKKLAASFFCSRLLPQCRDVGLIIPSIAYQLARASQPFRAALCQAMIEEPDAHTRLPEIQFNTLIVGPLFEVRETLPDNMVVVIDALDECENEESVGQILELFLAKVSDLPVKFIVSSRPEAGIQDQMGARDDQVSSRMVLVLDELEKGSVQADVETYLRATLKPMNPTEAQIVALVERTGISFAYAAKAVRYISYDNFRRNPRARVETVLNAKSWEPQAQKDL